MVSEPNEESMKSPWSLGPIPVCGEAKLYGGEQGVVHNIPSKARCPLPHKGFLQLGPPSSAPLPVAQQGPLLHTEPLGVRPAPSVSHRPASSSPVCRLGAIFDASLNNQLLPVLPMRGSAASSAASHHLFPGAPSGPLKPPERRPPRVGLLRPSANPQPHLQSTPPPLFGVYVAGSQ